MHISFRRIQKAAGEVVTVTDTLHLPRIQEENAQVQAMSPVTVRVEAEASTHLCRVRGSVQATVTYECSRCLENYSSDVETSLDESFTDLADQEDEDIHYVANDEIVLNPYVEEAINLALEIFPICSDDCQGLCPVCGVNKNHTSCSCEVERVDPRLAALKDLLSPDDSE